MNQTQSNSRGREEERKQTKDTLTPVIGANNDHYESSNITEAEPPPAGYLNPTVGRYDDTCRLEELSRERERTVSGHFHCDFSPDLSSEKLETDSGVG